MSYKIRLGSMNDVITMPILQWYRIKEIMIVAISNSHRLVPCHLAGIFLIDWWQPLYNAPSVSDLVVAFIVFLCVPNGA
jgi:hypothetical protein